jgi:RHS repeat-associated protein
VEFLYDVYARRVSKKVLRHDTQGDITLSHTHYIWDRVALLQEVDVLGPEPEVTRSYAYLEQGDEVSVGHLDEATGRWVYYHADHNGTPEELLDPQGNVVGRLARETFGKVSAASGETTAIRFPGQYADEETGLHYNRYRYYDPEAGRYISPDPINLSGGPNLYAYGPNPIGWFDPMGWEHGMLVTGVEGLDESVAGELRGTLFSSGMGEDCPPHLRSQARCHTERKFADRIREIAGGGRFKKGTRFHLKGALPPCPNCHRAMQKLADDCGGEYTYEYGNGQTVTYSGGTNPQFSDANLEAAYRMTPTSRMPRGAANQPQHVQDSLAFGYSFDNWNNATAGYSTAKGG